ncbi:MAG: GNAT family N-acetyltransferase, partial [Solirubrobacterales bacterium]
MASGLTARPVEQRGERERAFELRRTVFCGEQGVSEEAEFDGRDEDATQIVAVDGGEVVGTCRLLFEPPDCRLGRMAVAEQARGGGAGS